MQSGGSINLTDLAGTYRDLGPGFLCRIRDSNWRSGVAGLNRRDSRHHGQHKTPDGMRHLKLPCSPAGLVPVGLANYCHFSFRELETSVQ
jgi:hypothetical protein